MLWLVGRSRSRSDRWWDADQAFPVRRGHGHTYEAGPPGHDVSQNSRLRVSSLVFVERNVGGRKLNILVI